MHAIIEFYVLQLSWFQKRDSLVEHVCEYDCVINGSYKLIPPPPLDKMAAILADERGM